MPITRTCVPSGVESGGVLVSFAYDGDGARVSKTATGLTTGYVNDARGLSRVLQETKLGTTISHVPGVGQHDPLQLGNAQWAYFHGDAQNNRVLTDQGAAVSKRWDYDPFGVVRAQSGSANSDFQYAGEQKDQETGLINLRARYYDPALGRFLQRDVVGGTVGFPQSLNRYTYALNNPLRFLDPSGYCSEEDGWTGCEESYGEPPPAEESGEPPAEEAPPAESAASGGGEEYSTSGQECYGDECAYYESPPSDAQAASGAEPSGPAEQWETHRADNATYSEDQTLACAHSCESSGGQDDSSDLMSLALEICQSRDVPCDGLTEDAARLIIEHAEAIIQDDAEESAVVVALMTASRGPGYMKLTGVAAAILHGINRAAQHKQNWAPASLTETVNRLVGQTAEVVWNGQKLIYSSQSSRFQVVYDVGGDYFRIEDTALRGAHRYVTQYGNRIPENIRDLSTRGSPASLRISEPAHRQVYDALTHYRNIDPGSIP